MEDGNGEERGGDRHKMIVLSCHLFVLTDVSGKLPSR